MPFIKAIDKRWSLLLAETPHDFYQLEGFTQIEAELLGGEAIGWYEEEGKNRYLIPLVKRSIGQHYLHDLVSPYGYPGILSNTKLSSKEVTNVLLRFHQEATKEGFISTFIRLNPITNAWNLNSSEKPYNLPFIQVFHGETVSVDLKPSIITIRQKFSENHKRNIKKLNKQGFALTFNNWDFLDNFMEVYRQTMTRKSALPYYFFPIAYFEKLKKMLGDRLVFITILDKALKLQAGGLFTLTDKIMQYHLGATTSEALKFSPSKMMMDAAIVFGKLQNAEILHIGGGLSGNTADGLFRFKKGFGSHLHPFSTLRFIHQPEVYHKLIQPNQRKTIGDVFFPEYRNL